MSTQENKAFIQRYLKALSRNAKTPELVDNAALMQQLGLVPSVT